MLYSVTMFKNDHAMAGIQKIMYSRFTPNMALQRTFNTSLKSCLRFCGSFSSVKSPWPCLP